MESLLKHTFKRQLPYFIGATITGIIIAYYYGFLFSIIVNSIIWFIISTIVNKYYWHYTGFKDEKKLIYEYIINRKNNKSKINLNDNFKSKDKRVGEGSHSDIDFSSKNTDDDKTDNIGSPIK